MIENKYLPLQPKHNLKTMNTPNIIEPDKSDIISTSETLTTHRYITFDILRGFAVFMMIALHSLKHSINYDTSFSRDTGLTAPAMPGVLSFFLTVLLYLGTWDGLFLLVSMTVNVISIHSRVIAGKPLGDTIRNRVQWGSIIFLLGYLHNMIFGYYGVIVKSIRAGELITEPIFTKMFDFIALQIIGLSIIICSLILYILYRNDGVNRIRRNLTVGMIAIGIITFLTPVVNHTINSVYPGWPVQHKSWTIQQWNEVPIKLLFGALGGNPQPFFPYFITALVGMQLGLLMTNTTYRKYVPKISIITSIILFAIVVVAIMMGYQLELNFYSPDLIYLSLELAGQLLLTGILLALIEFGNYHAFFLRHTRYLRKWSMVALTVYYTQAIELLPRYLIHETLGWNTLTDHSLSISQSIIVLISVLFTWRLILGLWESKNFKWSLEYTIIFTLSGGKAQNPSRLNVAKVIGN